MEESTNIRLVDNTAPARRLVSDDDEIPWNTISQIPTSTTDLSRHSSRRWKTPSVRRTLTQRKYAKWQPHRLGIVDPDEFDAGGASGGDEGYLSRAATNTNTIGADSLMSVASIPTTTEGAQRVQSTDFATDNNTQDGGAASGSASGSGSGSRTSQTHRISGPKPGSEIDILYENQRGWFFFGVPLYSHKSLLNFDPSAWITSALRDSPVDITNAQLPDPSWEWAWKSWYVDMSGDVDDQGWQYSFSFSSNAWHGSHPWFHSFVRRRRWVRLRVKRAVERSRYGRSDFENAHRLNEDYFTIHSAPKRRRASFSDFGSHGPSERLSRVATARLDEEPTLEEISNIPTLLHALRAAIVDREKVDVLDKFLEEGGDELYYLEQQMPEIMSLFVFQASRWQFLTHLTNLTEELSRRELKAVNEGKETEAEDIRRRRGYLRKAAEKASHHLTGPEIFTTRSHESSTQMLDLTPISKKGSLISKHSRNFSSPPTFDGSQIKGIPQKAEIGREGHIY